MDGPHVSVRMPLRNTCSTVPFPTSNPISSVNPRSIGVTVKFNVTDISAGFLRGGLCWAVLSRTGTARSTCTMRDKLLGNARDEDVQI